jgi:hypothetical protein
MTTPVENEQAFVTGDRQRGMNEFFWQRMQDWAPLFRLLFMANVVFLFMMGVSLFLGEPSAATRVIMQITLVPIVISLLLSGFMIRKLR